MRLFMAIRVLIFLNMVLFCFYSSYAESADVKLKNTINRLPANTKAVTKNNVPYGQNDSVIIISGHVNTGGQPYYSLYVKEDSEIMLNFKKGAYVKLPDYPKSPTSLIDVPFLPLDKPFYIKDGDIYTSKWEKINDILGCQISMDYEPQFKKQESSGYKIYMIFKDTASKETCFKLFNSIDSIVLKLIVMGKRKDKNYVRWTTDFYEKKEFKVGPTLVRSSIQPDR